MRRVPYPVSIITATDPTPSHHHHHNSNNPPELSYRGMTVSSFNTVTLIPEPVISFNVKRPSETLTALRSSGRFLAHLLAPNKATATLARDFSKGNHNLTILDGKGEFEFVGVDVESSHGGDGRKLKLPILRRRGANPPDGMEDFPFVFECRVMDKEMEVYDHTIVLATVVRALVEPPGVVGEGRKDLCLTYADTRFWGAGREI
ncbi:oxidoreductase [Aspergillus sclerotialis]|uniref:Oxidoreductase n=1 Tax=Aspergillus sclerotialis TaxID=2070753 RepID=A0A3A2ZIA0_9EURO|nr:oxidoreductase [Aspergillus sclerotialis]